MTEDETTQHALRQHALAALDGWADCNNRWYRQSLRFSLFAWVGGFFLGLFIGGKLLPYLQ